MSQEPSHGAEASPIESVDRTLRLVHDPAGQPVAAITTAIPASRLKRPAMPRIVEALREAAAVIESKLGAGLQV